MKNKIDYEKLGKCFEEILNVDRQDFDNFHEDFVRIMVQFGYKRYLTEDEKQGYKENKDEYLRHINDYMDWEYL